MSEQSLAALAKHHPIPTRGPCHSSSGCPW